MQKQNKTEGSLLLKVSLPVSTDQVDEANPPSQHGTMAASCGQQPSWGLEEASCAHNEALKWPAGPVHLYGDQTQNYSTW